MARIGVLETKSGDFENRLSAIGCRLSGSSALILSLGHSTPESRQPFCYLHAFMSSNLAVSCRGLRKHYADVKAVDGLDLSITSRECFGLLGPNGAGKTTTIEILEGLTGADGGDVEVLGLSWERNATELRERIGISLQETQFYEKLSVYETLRLFRSFYRNGPDPDALLRDLSLDEKRDARVGKLSGGQKQRLAVACALIGDPDILFLDEPTTGLDPQSRNEMWATIRELVAGGTTLLLTTQYLEEADRLCDHIVILDKGREIASGTPDTLKKTVGGEQIDVVVRDTAQLQAARSALALAVGADPRMNAALRLVSVPVTSGASALIVVVRALDAAGIAIDDIALHRPTLDDVFLRLTGHTAESDDAETQTEVA
jgi:ABC-2 type transport system ATP-binding protein